MNRPGGNALRGQQHKELRRTSVPRRGLSQVEASVYIGVTGPKFDSLVKRGLMPNPKRVDGVLIWDRDQLDLYFQALPDVTAEPEVRRNPYD